MSTIELQNEPDSPAHDSEVSPQLTPLVPQFFTNFILGRLSHCSRRCSGVSRSRSNCWLSKLMPVDNRSAARDNSVFGGRPK